MVLDPQTLEGFLISAQGPSYQDAVLGTRLGSLEVVEVRC